MLNIHVIDCRCAIFYQLAVSVSKPLLLQQWNGTYFQRASLKEIGLRIQLGHPVGERCINPKHASSDDFVLLDTHGIHEIGLNYCGCEAAQPQHIQLLCNCWFGATITNPKTAATMRLLEHFHYLNFESKASAFEFYRALMRETDNTGLLKPKVSFHFFKWAAWR